MATPSRMPEPHTARWQPLRAGIQNLWEYDDQRFVFRGGRLLLRGRNESGKTKAVELLLPFLLDASLMPQRLDPFGTTSRPMKWNLLNDGNPDVSMNVGYVWLELGRRVDGVSRTLTLGAGLKAKRTIEGVDPWYFITEQRIDGDLCLFGEGRRPLMRPQLEEAVGAAGTVFTSPADYRRAVNARLFGLPDDQYDALMETLLQLRRPQLAKFLDLPGLSKVLSQSLPTLDQRVLTPLADGFDRLDADRRKREGFATTAEAVGRFITTYKRYAAQAAKVRLKQLTGAESAYQKARGEQRDAQEALGQARARESELTGTTRRLAEELDALDARLEALRSSDAFKAASELGEAERQAREAAERLQRAEGEAALEREGLRQGEERQRSLDDEVARGVEALAQVDARAVLAARHADLELAHGGLGSQLQAGAFDAAELVLREVLRERDAARRRMDEVQRALEALEREAEQADRRLRDADERLKAATLRLLAAERGAEAAGETYHAAIDGWLAGATALEVGPGAHAELSQAPLDDKDALARGLIETARERLGERRRLVDVELSGLERELSAVRAERERELASSHPAPAAPSWRPERAPERAGAPLYLLCDFRDGLEPAHRAGVEAGLEAAGLLDAWVMPDGTLLPEGVLDTALGEGPSAGRTLADALVAVEHGGVTAPVVEAVLRGIELVTDAEPETLHWVAANGRFRLGPLAGASATAAPRYVGATARERERQRRLAELAQRIDALEADVAVVRRRRDDVLQQTAEVTAAERRIPSRELLLQARAAVDNAAVARADAERGRIEASDGHLAALAAVRGGRLERDTVAIQTGLSRWVGRLSELDEVTRSYEAEARALLAQGHRVVTARRFAADGATSLQAARQRVERLEHAWVRARSDAGRSAARAEALRGAVGQSADEVLAQIEASERSRRALRAERAATDDLVREVVGRLATAAEAARHAEATVAAAAEARLRGETTVKELAGFGVLALFDAGDLGDPAAWTYTDTLLAARRLDAACGLIEASPEALDAADNRVSAGQQELIHALLPDIRLQPERVDGFLRYGALWNGRLLGLTELAAALRDEIAARDRLMADEERKLFESFLSGEAHAHLGARLRRARDLVERINEQIMARRTSSGMQIRLAWDVTAEAPAGTREAMALMLRAGELLSDADRTALRMFLQQRLAEAKQDDAVGTFHERMQQVLDYRGWFAFGVEYRSADGGWKPLTRKVHAAGSGGQKAVVLHLPLFAAAAAFYQSAAEHAPRIVILDEAFAGIDRPTRGELMGLLAEFGLDFVMTSYEEWGFYEQLDGLSTYHLAREPGVRGVYSEWFVWDGKRSVEMGSA